ncbi:MAG: YkgJ family cysteine cluster protein [bacterium]
MPLHMLKFWKKGLRFECVPGCRKCCEIPGIVFVHKSEIERIAGFLNVTPEKFKRTTLKSYWGDVYYLDYPEDKPCMFMDDTGCAIYEVRPLQCASFPFWPENLCDQKVWERLKKTCPGIDRGKMRSAEEILEILTRVGEKLNL